MLSAGCGGKWHWVNEKKKKQLAEGANDTWTTFHARLECHSNNTDLHHLLLPHF
jgi:hypothetical protein